MALKRAERNSSGAQASLPALAGILPERWNPTKEPVGNFGALCKAAWEVKVTGVGRFICGHKPTAS